MKKIISTLILSSIFATFAVGIGCDITTKSCYYAGYQGYSKKCGSSNSISDVLCRLSQATKWHTTKKNK